MKEAVTCKPACLHRCLPSCGLYTSLHPPRFYERLLAHRAYFIHRPPHMSVAAETLPAASYAPVAVAPVFAPVAVPRPVAAPAPSPTLVPTSSPSNQSSNKLFGSCVIRHKTRTTLCVMYPKEDVRYCDSSSRIDQIVVVLMLAIHDAIDDTLRR